MTSHYTYPELETRRGRGWWEICRERTSHGHAAQRKVAKFKVSQPFIPVYTTGERQQLHRTQYRKLIQNTIACFSTWISTLLLAAVQLVGAFQCPVAVGECSKNGWVETLQAGSRGLEGSAVEVAEEMKQAEGLPCAGEPILQHQIEDGVTVLGRAVVEKEADICFS